MPRKPLVRGNLPVYATTTRRLLRERDITHVRFAEMVGIAPQSMYAALNGGDIRVSTLFRMAKALNVEPHVLLMAPHEPPPADVEPAPSEKGELGNAIAILLAEVLKGRKA